METIDEDSMQAPHLVETLELDGKDEDDESKWAEVDDAGKHEEQEPREHPANRPVAPPDRVTACERVSE